MNLHSLLFESVNKIKYPRTFHLPWSLGATDDDKTHDEETVEKMFSGKEVIVLEKIDGENTSIYSTGECHARSLDSKNHPSRDYVKAKARELGCMGIPTGWRIMGENMYAKHSIEYDLLSDYFIVFGIADSNNVALSWSEVEEWAELLDLHTVPVLYRGLWDAEHIKSLYPFNSAFKTKGHGEGYVVRVVDRFPMDQFGKYVAKFVRKNHVQTDTHWMHSTVVPNKIIKNSDDRSSDLSEVNAIGSGGINGINSPIGIDITDRMHHDLWRNDFKKPIKTGSNLK